jgi:hypothetical protein
VGTAAHRVNRHSVTICVAWRPDGGQRDRLWAWCYRRWRARTPFDVVWADEPGPGVFNRGASLNKAAAGAGDVLVLADADTIVNLTGLRQAISRVSAGEVPWSVAYPRAGYYALTETATEHLLALDPADAVPDPVPGQWRERITSHSGCVVVRHADFDAIGGFDPRPIGWGFEDDILRAKCDLLLGPHWRPGGWVMHLHHPHVESERFGQPHIGHNRALSDRYAAVSADVAGMRALIAETVVAP